MQNNKQFRPVDPIHVQVIYRYTYLEHCKNLIHKNSYLVMWIRRWFQKVSPVSVVGSNPIVNETFFNFVVFVASRSSKFDHTKNQARNRCIEKRII